MVLARTSSYWRSRAPGDKGNGAAAPHSMTVARLAHPPHTANDGRRGERPSVRRLPGACHRRLGQVREREVPWLDDLLGLPTARLSADRARPGRLVPSAHGMSGPGARMGPWRLRRTQLKDAPSRRGGAGAAARSTTRASWSISATIRKWRCAFRVPGGQPRRPGRSRTGASPGLSSPCARASGGSAVRF